MTEDQRPSLATAEGRTVGHLELRRSGVCSTVWVMVIFKPGLGRELTGGEVRLVMVRPGDEVRSPYVLPLKYGNDYGYSNMLSDSASCVHAEVSIKAPDSSRFGPTVTTICA